MRTPQRRLDSALVESSLQEPERYEFFQLVRLYELIFHGEDGRFGVDVVNERIRFRNSLRLGFAPCQIDAITPRYAVDDEGLDSGKLEQVDVTPSFMGMLGVNGTLPIHYTEQVIDHARFKRDESGRAFLDLFTNRAVGHFYRAWKKFRLPVQYETDRQNRFLPLILALGGLGFDALRERFSTSPGRHRRRIDCSFCRAVPATPRFSRGTCRRLLAAISAKRYGSSSSSGTGTWFQPSSVPDPWGAKT